MFTENFYSDLYFADGSLTAPQATAGVKQQAIDFQVDEMMNIECTGEGEHIWLQISKRQTHSDQIAKSLAKLAGIHAKDIGISGMKDYRASTSQWFSVWLPGVKDQDLPEWQAIENDLVSIDHVARHNRKLKRGTHIGNQFKIVLRDVGAKADSEDESKGGASLESLEEKLLLIQSQGVPNYFGEQRFGRGGSNLQQAYVMFESGRKIKQRQKRSMLLSSARSWLFNLVLSERLKAGTWLTPSVGEPLNLSGSRQFFIAEDMQDAQQRMQQLDVHTTAPLWGQGSDKLMQDAADLHAFEMAAIEQCEVFKQGLEKERLDYARRALRFVPEDLSWQVLESSAGLPDSIKTNGTTFDLELCFTLGRGQFATSVLRELVQAKSY